MNDDPNLLQTLWNWGLTVVTGVAGYLFVRNEGMHKGAADERQKLREKLSDFEKHVASSYVPRGELERTFDRIDEKLDTIMEHLLGKRK